MIEKIEKLKNNIFVFICMAIGLTFISILILNAVSGAAKSLDIKENANFVEVEATVVKYEKVYDSHWETYSNGINKNHEIINYCTIYEYVAPDGGVYSSYWQTRINTEEEAKRQIGMKVTVYIDDELNLQTKSLDFDRSGVTVGTVLGTVFLLFVVCLLIASVISIKRLRKYQEIVRKSDKSLVEKTRKPKNFCTLHFFIITAAIFACVISIFSARDMEKSYQTFINADFQEVEATLYEYKEFEKNGLLYYAMFYKYEAPNGDEFTGFWQNDINSKEDAEAAIGSKVKVYYDENMGFLESMNDLQEIPKPDTDFVDIVVPVSIVLFVNSLTRFIIFAIKDKKYSAQQQGEAQRQN